MQMRLTLCTLFNMNYHFLNTYYYCVHFSNYIVLFLSLLHKDAHVHIRNTRNAHTLTCICVQAHSYTHTAECLCDGCILMRSNKDGNDPVHFSLYSLSVCVTLCLSHPLTGTQLLVYMKPKLRVRGILLKWLKKLKKHN